jgi:hypothetical protein
MWSFDGQWRVVSREKNKESELERALPFEAQGKRARMGFDIHGRE